MKSMRIAVAVTAIIACVCIFQSSALPFSESEPRAEEQMESEPRAQELQWTAHFAEETNPEVLFRGKRTSHLSLCRYCCKCCRNKGCGFCCRF
ncbi:hepcidin-1 [Electrophorus electricus]|uniref:Hepcidin n=2 Tax=Electrophorus TaxID=8004 RepID=A0AAY5F408_ELEEL|nr:hepcidin-1 [Electrophorus electricus]